MYRFRHVIAKKVELNTTKNAHPGTASWYAPKIS